MKLYLHHIGDFDRATRHLTRIERSVYRDLIELYYETEQQLTLDVAALCRKIIARSDEESTAVQQVLNEFFTQTSTGWYHDRCEEVIAEYRSHTSAKAMAGKASAAARRLRALNASNARPADDKQAANGCSTPVEHVLNGCATEGQLTVNRKPLTVNQEDQELSDQQTPLILTDPPDGGQDGSGTKPKGRRRRQGEPTGDALCDIVIGAYESILCAPERKGKCLKVSALTPKRTRRIKEADAMARGFCAREGLPYSADDFWPKYFQECMQDAWMKGDVPNPKNADWKPHLDLLIDETRFTKIMDKVVTRQ